MDVLLAQGGLEGELLAVLAHLAPRPVPLELIASRPKLLSADEPGLEDLREALGALEAAGLLARTEAALAISGELAREVLAALDAERARAACGLALDLLAAAFPPDADDYRRRERCRVLMPHAFAATTAARRLELRTEAAGTVLHRAAEFLISAGDFVLAEELAEDAFALAPAELDGSLLGSLNFTLARARHELGNLAAARDLVERASDLHAAAGEEAAHELRRDQVLCAEILGRLGELETARGILASILEGPARPGGRTEYIARRCQGRVLMEAGDLDGARAAFDMALVETEALCGPGHPDLAEARGELGALLLERGEWARAREELEAARDLAERTLGAEHPTLGRIRSNLGDSLRGLGELEAARTELEAALAIGEARLPAGHRGIWLRHRKLVQILRRMGAPEDAARHAEAAAQISERALGPRKLDAVRDQLELADLLGRTGEERAARERFERALPLLESARGVDSPELARRRRSFGRVLARLGDLATARSELSAALEVYRAHGLPQTMAVEVALARVLDRLAAELAAGLADLDEEEDGGEVVAITTAARRAAVERWIEASDLEGLTRLAGILGAEDRELATRVLGAAEELAAARTPEEASAEDTAVVVSAWRVLGLRLYIADRYAESAEAFERALALAVGGTAVEGEVLHELADANRAGGETRRAVDLYLRAAGQRRETADLDGLSETLLALGRSRQRLGELEGALESFEERLALISAAPSPDHAAEASTLLALAGVHRERGDLLVALGLVDRALDIERDLGAGEGLADALLERGRLLRRQDEAPEALASLAECLEVLRGLPEPVPISEAIALQDMARIEHGRGRLAAALELSREATALMRTQEDRQGVAMMLLTLGRLLEEDGDLEAAEAAARERLVLLDRSAPTWATAITRHDLADAVRGQGRLDEAIGIYRRALAEKRETDDPPSIAFTMLSLARALVEAGRPAEAAPLLEERLALLRSLPGRDAGAEATTLHELAEIRESQGDAEAAISLYREALGRRREAAGGRPPAGAMVVLAAALMSGASGGRGTEVAEERRLEALGLLQEAEVSLVAEEESPPAELAAVKAMVAMTLSALARTEEAAAAAARAREAFGAALAEELAEPDPERLHVICLLAPEVGGEEISATALARLRELIGAEDFPGDADELLIGLLRTLGRSAERRGELAAAAAHYGERLGLLEARPEADRAALAETLEDLGDVAVSEKRPAEAMGLYERAASLRRETGEDAALALTLGSLAGALMEAGESARSRLTAEEALQIYRSMEDPDLHRFLGLLALTAARLGESSGAAPLLAEAEEILGRLPAEDPDRGDAERAIASVREHFEGRGEETG